MLAPIDPVNATQNAVLNAGIALLGSRGPCGYSPSGQPRSDRIANRRCVVSLIGGFDYDRKDVSHIPFVNARIRDERSKWPRA